MVDITQVEDIDIRSSVDAFEAALKSKATILPLPKLERILLAVDRSNQGRRRSDLRLRWRSPITRGLCCSMPMRACGMPDVRGI